MEPSSKRRRLAPKIPETPVQPSLAASAPSGSSLSAEKSQSYPPPQDAGSGSTTAAVPERHDFESFARHLQDAAMLIHRQTQKSPYAHVSVLMLRWEEDASVDRDLVKLERVFRDKYNYRTETWHIPTVPNPSIKLGVQMASFLEHARPDHLLIIYYAGHGYVGKDNQLYWACNHRDDAARLKWDGVRCLFEDAQSDILLLLDSCAVSDSPVAGSHGVKQAIAAYSPEQASREPAPRSFTTCLTDALHKLSNNGRPFSVPRLYDELLVQTQRETSPPRAPNGTSHSGSSSQDKAPVFFSLTPGKGQNLSLAPLSSRPPNPQSSAQSNDSQGTAAPTREDQLISPGTVVDLTFDEARVLVCTTFVGDASRDMTFFDQWLVDTPPVASKITVEGMFLGPPTMLLISMPQSIWNVVQHDKVCCFLGYIGSHNMIHLYQKLVDTASVNPVTKKEVEEGRILLEAREAAAASPGVVRREISSQYSAAQPDHPPLRQTANGRQPLPGGPSGRRLLSSVAGHKSNVEESAEVQEAAEQLKALSHVRTHGAASKPDRRRAGARDSIDVRRSDDPDSGPDVNESGADETHHASSPFTPGTSKSRTKRSSLKQTPKQETRCTLCTHVPFKDSSSLRKHIAAAHTRPFPCAFSFAGCSSTFGSKNEWKRHIASQHLCLQYYRCSTCPQSTAEGKGNEFNRKDLFTQHLRRMHAPFAIKKAFAKGDSKLQVEWDSHVKEMQQSCLITRRQPPQRSSCPCPGCQTEFEGSKAWDEWTEHVGHHMEKGEAQKLGVDSLLADWALNEGIIERKEDGGYKLCGGAAVGGDRDAGNTSVNSAEAAEAKQDDDDPSITVATSTLASDQMMVD